MKQRANAATLIFVPFVVLIISSWTSPFVTRTVVTFLSRRVSYTNSKHEYAWTEGPEKFGWSHERSAWCTKEQKYIEVMKTASAKSRRKAMTSSSRLSVLQERERLEGVEAWRRPDTRRHRRRQVWVVWASKPPRMQVSLFDP